MRTVIVLLALSTWTSHAAMGTAPWASLNDSLSGRLQATTPLALPCFSLYNGQPHAVDSTSCTEIRDNYTSNRLRTSHVEGYMNFQSEMCLSDPADQCLLDNTVLPAPLPSSSSSSSSSSAMNLSRNCGQGSVPAYHITIESAADVLTAFAFARSHKVELSVKNTGHDYMLRSSGRGTLTLYTHHLQNMTYHASFISPGCNNNNNTDIGKAKAKAAITLGPGVDASTAIAFADVHNSTILTAYSPTVGLSGGWVQGAGHSVLSPVYGLGADRVLAYEVVTPDGHLRTVSACSHPELFWALRGGGGGTFGVVLAATHAVEPRMPVAFVNIKLLSSSSSSSSSSASGNTNTVTTEQAWQWIELMVRESLAWGRKGWGGHLAGTYLTYFNPLPEYTTTSTTTSTSDGPSAGGGEERARADFANATAFAESIGGTSQILVGESFHALWTTYLAPNFTAQAAGTVLSSRLVPRDMFATREGQDSVLGLLRSMEAAGWDPTGFYCPVTTPFVWTGTGSPSAEDVARARKETAVVPSWYDALWSLGQSIQIPWNSTYETRLSLLTNLTNMTRQSDALSPGTGSYVNEANPFTSNYVDSWWGENYEKLHAIKQQYDPDALLKCWKCVGFTDEDMDLERFQCQAKMQRDIDAAFGLA